MIERQRGHIVALSSVSGLIGVPEGVIYCATKFAVRGFMEALVMQLQHDGHDKYIKTTTSFPYFVDTRPYLKDVVENGMTLKKIYSAKECGEQVVDAILKEIEIVTLPNIFYYLIYLMAAPMPLKKFFNKHSLKKGYKMIGTEETC